MEQPKTQKTVLTTLCGNSLIIPCLVGCPCEPDQLNAKYIFWNNIWSLLREGNVINDIIAEYRDNIWCRHFQVLYHFNSLHFFCQSCNFTSKQDEFSTVSTLGYVEDIDFAPKNKKTVWETILKKEQFALWVLTTGVRNILQWLQS